MRAPNTLLVGVALLAGFALAAPPVASAAEPPPAVDDDEPEVERVLLQLKLKRGGKTLTHPGHMTETGSEIILVLTQGKREHEIAVYLEKKGGKYKAEVKYTDGGTAVLEQETTLDNKKWGKVTKGSTEISLRVNNEAKRPDELDLPGGKNPLDGLK